MARGFALAAFLTVLAAALSAGALASPARTAAAPFPVTVTVTNGKVTVPKRPARIVSLSPTATETLFAIGAGAQVVAVDDQSDYPKNAPRTTLSGFTPNVESIAGYRPDLVVISFDPKGLSEALGKLGIPVVHQDAAATLKGAYQQIRQLRRGAAMLPTVRIIALPDVVEEQLLMDPLNRQGRQRPMVGLGAEGLDELFRRAGHRTAAQSEGIDVDNGAVVDPEPGPVPGRSQSEQVGPVRS